MNTNIQKHYRKSNRLKDYDYSLPGTYFITAVTFQRAYLFGEIADGKLSVNSYGSIVTEVWSELPNHYPYVSINAFVVMPNHIHGIIQINEIELDLQIPHTKIKNLGFSEIVRALKSFSARRINHLRSAPGIPVWQRSFYDHIIRDERDYQNIYEYIQINPQAWEDDRFHL